MTGTLILLSGGMDSTVLAAQARHAGEHVETISLHYGQRHARELDAASQIAVTLGVRHDVIDLTTVGQHLRGSALTDADVSVPEGHYAADTMRATVVPNRNAIMIAVAVGVASARGLHQVATAVHAGDHFVYPDCRPEFIAAADRTARLGTAGFGDVSVVAPFAALTKADIARIGHDIGAPLALTWSCYVGDAAHCGRCGTCVERHEAFRLAHVPDPTTYADATFAIEATR